MNWKHLFRPHILERGFDYYREGAVEDFFVGNDIIEATVCGNDDYEVEIHLYNNEIADMYCSCPYASDGKNCKHMVAVLYEWGNSDTSIAQPKNIDLAKAIDSADETLVRSFLYDILSNDSVLANKFMLLCPDSHFNLYSFKLTVEDIIYNYSDHDGYVNYYSAHKFFNAIDEILYDNIDLLLKNKQYNEAFELSVYVAQRIGQVEIDDSDGGITMMFSRCYDIWRLVLEHSNNEEQRHYFDILKTYASITDADLFCVQSFFEDFLINHFNYPSCTNLKTTYLDDRIEDLSGTDDSYKNYCLQSILLQRLNLISDSSEQEAFCKKHWSYPDIRKQYISFCIDKEDYDLAIRTLTDSIVLDANLPGLTTSYKRQLKDLYKLTADYDSYMSLLKELVISLGGSDPDLFFELKSQYTEDAWIKMRNDLLEQMPTLNIHVLYNAEGMYSELLKCALSCNGLYLVSQYESILVELFPKQVLEKYTAELNKSASYSGTRNQYQALMTTLRNMKRLPGGKERADEIAANWKVQYKRRSAMMDELSRL